MRPLTEAERKALYWVIRYADKNPNAVGLEGEECGAIYDLKNLLDEGKIMIETKEEK